MSSYPYIYFWFNLKTVSQNEAIIARIDSIGSICVNRCEFNSTTTYTRSTVVHRSLFCFVYRILLNQLSRVYWHSRKLKVWMMRRTSNSWQNGSQSKYFFQCVSWSEPVYNSSVRKVLLSLRFPPDFTHIHQFTFTVECAEKTHTVFVHIKCTP